MIDNIKWKLRYGKCGALTVNIKLLDYAKVIADENDVIYVAWNCWTSGIS